MLQQKQHYMAKTVKTNKCGQITPLKGPTVSKRGCNENVNVVYS